MSFTFSLMLSGTLYLQNSLHGAHIQYLIFYTLLNKDIWTHFQLDINPKKAIHCWSLWSRTVLVWDHNLRLWGSDVLIFIQTTSACHLLHIETVLFKLEIESAKTINNFNKLEDIKLHALWTPAQCRNRIISVWN